MIPMLDHSERHRLDEARLAAAFTDPDSRFVLFDRDRVLLSRDTVEPIVVTGRQLREWEIPPDAAVHLGVDGETAWFGVDVEPLRPADVDGTTGSVHLTQQGAFVALASIADPIEAGIWGLLSQARALLAWNRATANCPACGGATASVQGGYRRRCLDPACGETQFARTDPAVIVRVVRGQRCLLARSARFHPGVRSVLAGFVDPGETLEAAVRREVGEEVGLELDEVRYLGSQPWPFPMSLMIAFEAVARGETIRIDADELDAADWYSREDVKEQVRDGRLVLPSEKSIARRMIDAWISGRAEI